MAGSAKLCIGAIVAVSGFWVPPSESYAAEPTMLPKILHSGSQLQWRTPNGAPSQAMPAPQRVAPVAPAPQLQPVPQIVRPAAMPSGVNSARIKLVAGEEPIADEAEMLRPVANLAPIEPIPDQGNTPGIALTDAHGPADAHAPAHAAPHAAPAHAAPVHAPAHAAPVHAPAHAAPGHAPDAHAAEGHVGDDAHAAPGHAAPMHADPHGAAGHGEEHVQIEGAPMAPMLAPPMRTPMRLAPPTGPMPAAPLELPGGPNLAPPGEGAPHLPMAEPMHEPMVPMRVPGGAAPGVLPPGLDPVGPQNPGIRPAPAAPLNGGEFSKGKACDRYYNGRDICDEDGQCARAWQDLQGVTIRDISLDLTPSYDPTARSRADSNQKRDQRLGLNARRLWFDAAGQPLNLGVGLDGRPTNVGELVAVSGGEVTIKGPGGNVNVAVDGLGRDEQMFVRGREWKNRHGQVLAQGRMVDFANGEIHVKQANGAVIGIPYRGLGEDEVAFVAAYWEIPLDCRFSDANYREIAINDAVRFQHCVTMTWKASALCHKPLWFEDVNLERYGHTRGPFMQPLASCAHFFGNICVLPYNMGMDPPGECQYALGYYRPGSCAPWLINAIPLSPRGAAAEAGVVLGIGYIVP